MDQPIVTGLLAYGMSGKIFHAPFLSTNSHFQFRAVVERHNKTVKDTYTDVVSYDSVDDLLADDTIELVVINTPSYTHYPIAKQALQVGKHVLLEKPAAATSHQVKELFDLAKSVDKKLMIYQNRRFDSEFKAVKSIVDSGRLGELVEAHFRYDRYRITLGKKIFKETKGYEANGLLYDLGPHLLDQAIVLFGRPVSFDKVMSTHRPNSQVDDYFSYRLTYPNGLNVFLTASLMVAEPLASSVINGTLGSFIKGRDDVQEAQLMAGVKPTDPGYGIEKPGSEGKLYLMSSDTDKETELVPSERGNYNDIFDAVYQTVRHNKLYPITEEQIAWQIELLEAPSNA